MPTHELRHFNIEDEITGMVWHRRKTNHRLRHHCRRMDRSPLGPPGAFREGIVGVKACELEIGRDSRRGWSMDGTKND